MLSPEILMQLWERGWPQTIGKVVYPEGNIRVSPVEPSLEQMLDWLTERRPDLDISHNPLKDISHNPLKDLLWFLAVWPSPLAKEGNTSQNYEAATLSEAVALAVLDVLARDEETAAP